MASYTVIPEPVIQPNSGDLPPFSTLQFKVADKIGYLTLNRPGALNALNRAMADALEDALTRVAAMDEVTVLTVAGRGRGVGCGLAAKPPRPRSGVGPHPDQPAAVSNLRPLRPAPMTG